MMKQFLRVKQIADHKFQRNDKLGILTDEMTAAEKRVELIRDSCNATGKKLSGCIACDNRTKKSPEAAFAQCMEEWGLQLGEDSILGLTLVDFARIQDALASDLLSYRLQVEDNIVEPLQTLLNADASRISKVKKQLGKLTAEMDYTKIKYENSKRNSHSLTNNNSIAKTQLLKEETEDVVSRVDQCRDSLTTEILNIISREPELSHIFVKLCHLQLDYHRKAFYLLESALPDLEEQINCCPYQPVFGIPLEEHLRISGREIAIVLESCVCWLLQSAMKEEGLFRVVGSMSKIKKMKSAFDASLQHLIDERDPHNIAGLLKLYLRSLPEPLLTFQLYDHWMAAAAENDHERRLQSLWSVINSLPETHFNNLRYLIKFLSKLCQSSEFNKMSSQNVAIVIGPNLLWPQVNECTLGMDMTATNLHSSIVDTLITYCDYFFPGECEFFVSTPTTPRHIEGFPFKAFTGSQLSLAAKLSNGDSAVDSMSSSPTNSSPKSPSPRVPLRPKKKTAPKAPQLSRSPIIRSASCAGTKPTVSLKADRTIRGPTLSMSHENLINGSVYCENVFNGSSKNDECSNQEIKFRPKPPRNLPPVVERSRRSVERPSVPPPERPDSVLIKQNEVVDPDDISISFESSESESYNECQMSFGDDSDGDLHKQDDLSSDRKHFEEINCQPPFEAEQDIQTSNGPNSHPKFISEKTSQIRNSVYEQVSLNVHSDKNRQENDSIGESSRSSFDFVTSKSVAPMAIRRESLELGGNPQNYSSIKGAFDCSSQLFEKSGKDYLEHYSNVKTHPVRKPSKKSHSVISDFRIPNIVASTSSCKNTSQAYLTNLNGDGHREDLVKNKTPQEVCSVKNILNIDSSMLPESNSADFHKLQNDTGSMGSVSHSYETESNPISENVKSTNVHKIRNNNENRGDVGYSYKTESNLVSENVKSTDVNKIRNNNGNMGDVHHSYKTESNLLSENVKSTERVMGANNILESRLHDHINSELNGKEKNLENIGGTPTFFEHYGEDRQHRNSVWFENVMEEDCFDENFRTIIEVGSSGNCKNGISRPTLSGNAIKLRVNSETQDTRL